MIGSSKKLLMARAGAAPPIFNDISFVSSTGRVNLGATGTITLPSGMEPGDIVIIGSMGDNVTPAVPSGYTLGQQGNEISVAYVWSYKVMGDPVDTTATGLTSSASVAHLALVYRGDSATPSVQTPPPVNQTASGMPDGPSVSAVNGNMVVTIGFLDDTSAPAQDSFLEPSGYTFGAASARSSSAIMAAHLKVLTSGNYDPGPFLGWTTTEPSIGATFVLR